MVDFDACLGSPNSDDVMTFPRGLMYDHVRIKMILSFKGNAVLSKHTGKMTLSCESRKSIIAG